MVKPVRAKKSHVCGGCGGSIIAGVSRVMKRYSHGDWVHARPDCLHSTEDYGQRTPWAPRS